MADFAPTKKKKKKKHQMIQLKDRFHDQKDWSFDPLLTIMVTRAHLHYQSSVVFLSIKAFM